MSGLLLDLRGAARLLRRRQATALLAVCTLALGIGANTAIFAVTRGVLLRPLPYQEPDRLVMIWRAPKNRAQADEVVRTIRGIATPLMLRNRTDSDPDATAALIRTMIRAIDPAQPVQRITTIDQIVSESIADRRLYAVATVAFAIVTLLLAAAGVCGVLAQAVTERTRELGIRSAVGAAPRDQIATVMRQGMLPIAGGLVLGVIGALWATRLLQQFLFQVGVVDPIAYLATALSVAAIGALACYIPARHAARLDPMTALRWE